MNAFGIKGRGANQIQHLLKWIFHFVFMLYSYTVLDNTCLMKRKSDLVVIINWKIIKGTNLCKPLVVDAGTTLLWLLKACFSVHIHLKLVIYSDDSTIM